MMDVNKYITVADLVKAIQIGQKQDFENIFTSLGATFTGKHVYGFSSGHGALSVLIKARGWKKVGLPSFVCPRLYQAIKSAGAKPVVLDVEAKTFNLSSTSFKKQPDIQAIIVVHTFGVLADIFKIRQVLPKGVEIIEDCAHAIGVGGIGLGDHLLFSLYKQTGNIGGAMLITKTKLEEYPRLSQFDQFFKIAPRLTIFSGLRNYWRSKSNLPVSSDVIEQTFGLSSLVFNLFAVQIPEVLADLPHRRKLITFYRSCLDSRLFTFQEGQENGSGMFFNVLIKSNIPGIRNKILLKLRQNKIFCDRQWYDTMAFSQKTGRDLAEKIINIPLSDRLEKVEFINKVVRENIDG
jgi:dTDP-4-amino-4,6-dideoxygalactose transaminase